MQKPHPYAAALFLLAAAFCCFCQPAHKTTVAATAEEKGKSNKEEEKPVHGPGTGVAVSATVKSSSFSNGQIQGPAYEIKLQVKNYSPNELQLGDVVMVLEKEKGSDLFASSYVARETAGATAPDKDREKDAFSSAFSSLDAVTSFKRRFQMDWGEDIDNKGSSLQIFSAGGRIAISLSSPGIYQGLGWGRVSAHAERTIEYLVPFPFKVKGTRESLALVAPSVRTRSAMPGNASVTILRFDPEEVKEGEGFKLAETTVVPLRTADLQAMVNNKQLDAWRRLFAMNWLVDASSKTVGPLLLHILNDQGSPVILRAGAGTNLAKLKSKEAVQSLIAILANAPDDKMRWWSIEDLGEIGDLAAAPSIRNYLTNSTGEIAASAMQAVGKLKDPDAVAPLLAILADKKNDNRHAPAASSLAAIGNADAVKGLLAILNDKQSRDREMVAGKLGESGAADAIPALAAIANDPGAPEGLRRSAIGSLGKLGGPDSLTALRRAATGDKEPARAAALSALADTKDAGAVAALIEYAENNGYASRKEAIAVLGRAKKTEALPSLRKLAGDKTAPGAVRARACEALRNMEDKQAVASLQSALDDSDKEMYSQALMALHEISAKDSEGADLAALKSVHSEVRRLSAEHIKEAKTPNTARPLWTAYQAERDEYTGTSLVEAMTAVKFNDRSVVSFLIARLDAKTNKLWFSDVELLRLISGQKFGPEFRYGDEKIRDAELAKWREWGAAQKQ